MKAISPATDILPITEFTRDTARFIAHLHETGQPTILTVDGKPSVVVMDPDTWFKVQEQHMHAQTITAIRTGLEQARDGQGILATILFDSLAAKPPV